MKTIEMKKAQQAEKAHMATIAEAVKRNGSYEEMNAFGGSDFYGPHGMTRWTRDADDGRRDVLMFAGVLSQTMWWKLQIPDEVPEEVFEAAHGRAKKLALAGSGR